MTRRDPYLAAYVKGYNARGAGEPRTANPYADKRKADGRLTFSRAWRNGWCTGWDQRDAELRAVEGA